jgi:hypothetical protein
MYRLSVGFRDAIAAIHVSSELKSNVVVYSGGQWNGSINF